MNYVLSILMGYLFGCFQTSYILAKLTKNIDIREHGSGNAGTTNAVRVMGWKFGVMTFLGDIFKAVIAVVIARALFDSELAGIIAGAGVVFGHNWPFVLKFKGGKGVASTLGVLLAYDIRIGLIAFAISATVVYITRYVSLGSLLLITLMPIGILIFHEGSYQELAVALLLSVVALYRHKENIKKLLKGKENKIGSKK